MLVQLSSSKMTGQRRPPFYGRDPRGVHAIGVEPFTPYKGIQANQDIQKTMGNITLPSCDGLVRSFAKEWVQKLDTYLQLNPLRGGCYKVCFLTFG